MLLPLLLAAACQSAPPGPQITPLNATIKLGRISAKTLAGRIDIPDAGTVNSAVGVGGAAWGGGGWSGGSVGFSVNLNQLLNPLPQPQMDLGTNTRWWPSMAARITVNGLGGARPGAGRLRTDGLSRWRARAAACAFARMLTNPSAK
ncbi:hypothetical protein ACU4GD_45320 [Cupriavidus basilensis]